MDKEVIILKKFQDDEFAFNWSKKWSRDPRTVKWYWGLGDNGRLQFMTIGSQYWIDNIWEEYFMLYNSNLSISQMCKIAKEFGPLMAFL